MSRVAIFALTLVMLFVSVVLPEQRAIGPYKLDEKIIYFMKVGVCWNEFLSRQDYSPEIFERDGLSYMFNSTPHWTKINGNILRERKSDTPKEGEEIWLIKPEEGLVATLPIEKIKNREILEWVVIQFVTSKEDSWAEYTWWSDRIFCDKRGKMKIDPDALTNIAAVEFSSPQDFIDTDFYYYRSGGVSGGRGLPYRDIKARVGISMDCSGEDRREIFIIPDIVISPHGCLPSTVKSETQQESIRLQSR